MEGIYITKIYIDKVRHLKNITIDLSAKERKPLILTGKNGSGKTSILNSIKSYLETIETGIYTDLLNKDKEIKVKKNFITSIKNKTNINENEKNLQTQLLYNNIKSCEKIHYHYGKGLKLFLTNNKLKENLCETYKKGEFILSYFDSNRKTKVDIPQSIEKVSLSPYYSMDSKPSNIFVKYLVDLKTQQAFAKNEGDIDIVKDIQKWFDEFEKDLKILIDDNLKLKFDYKNYNFEIIQNNREPYRFDRLPDGYSSILNIIMDLILRMENKRTESYNVEGIVLIDEIESHLDIELQKNILPFLIKFFPNIQFIVTTHSPFILGSIHNGIIYDLEKNRKIKNLEEI